MKSCGFKGAVAGFAVAAALAGGAGQSAWAQEIVPVAASTVKTVSNAGAAGQNEIPTFTRPDVQVVVLPMPTGKWGVSTVYSKQVSKGKAEARLKALLQAGGWRPESVVFENGQMKRENVTLELPPDMSAEEKAEYQTKLPPPSVMSSLTFETVDNVVDFGNGTMNLAPFARAFRDLNRVHVTYIVPQTFVFRGVRHFENADVSLDMMSGGQGAYTYVMNIKNHQMEKVAIPVTQALAPVQNDRRGDTRRSAALQQQKRMVGGGLVVVIALLAGIVVYLWAQKLSKS